jgi:hypothetical protein
MHHRALAEAFSSAGADRLLLSAAPTIHFICDFFTTERGVFRFSFLPAFAGTGDGGTQPKKRYHYTVPEVSGKEKMLRKKNVSRETVGSHITKALSRTGEDQIYI